MIHLFIYCSLRYELNRAMLIIRVEIKCMYVCMYVGRYVCMLHRLSRTLRRVKQRTERDDKKQA